MKQFNFISDQTLMSAEVIYDYCNQVIGINAIRQAMRNGEIKRCRLIGNGFNAKMVVQKRYVDIWLDWAFAPEKPTSIAGMSCIPIDYAEKLAAKAARKKWQ